MKKPLPFRKLSPTQECGLHTELAGLTTKLNNAVIAGRSQITIGTYLAKACRIQRRLVASTMKHKGKKVTFKP